MRFHTSCNSARGEFARPLVRQALAACCLAASATAQFGHIDPPGPVEIVYDTSGIPHIYSFQLPAAEADKNVFYGLGYQQMRDFPLQTLDTLYASSGQYAEVLGITAVPRDRFVRHWELPERAAQWKTELMANDPFGVLPKLQAYVDGIEDGRAWWRNPANASTVQELLGLPMSSPNREFFYEPLPLFFEVLNRLFDPEPYVLRMFSTDAPAVTVEHVLAGGYALSAGFYHSEGVGAGFSELIGSNSWIGRAADGSVVAMSDGHLPFQQERFYGAYFVQLSGGDYDASGWTLPGFPCLVTGYNQHQSWVTSVGGTGPKPTFDPVNIGNTPVVATTWSADLEDPGTGNLTFDYAGAPVAIEESDPPETIKVFQGSTLTETFWYVPTEDASITPRYPIVVEAYQGATLQDPPPAPVVGPIEFRQTAVLTGAPAWEHMIGMALAETVAEARAVVDRAQYGFGGAINLLVADDAGDFHYTYMATVPMQGSGAIAGSPWETQPVFVLDGSEPDQRWAGIHPASDLPSFSTDLGATGPDVWINCNVTPDFVGPSFTSTAPSYMLEATPVKTWRQVRAEELLRGVGAPAFTADESADAARDVQDVWMATLWPHFLETYEEELQGDLDVEALVDFVEQEKFDGELPGASTSRPFLAEPHSRVTVFTTLLRAVYEREIDCGENCLTVEQRRFGFDAAYTPPDPTVFATAAAWKENRDAVVAALGEVAGLFVNTPAPNPSNAGPGLGNLLAVTQLDGVLTDPPPTAGDPTPITPQPWAALRALEPAAVRWGMVNVLSLTPHGQQFAGYGGDCASFTNEYMTNFYPPAMPNPVLYNTSQPVAVYPVGGVRGTSLFSASLGPYDQFVYPCFGANELYFSPMEFGSSVPFSVEFPAAGGGPVTRFMSAFGATGIVTDITNLGIEAGDRFRPSADFANRVWRDFEHDFFVLKQPGNHIHRLTLAGP